MRGELREVAHPVGGFAHENILQSGMNQIDNKCLRICEPYGACSLPFYLMQLSLVLSLSAYSMGCHTAAAAAAARAHVGGENAWLQCPLVAAGGTCAVETWKKSSKRGAPRLPEVVFSQKTNKKCHYLYFCALPRNRKLLFTKYISGKLFWNISTEIHRDANMGKSSRTTKRRLFWSSLKC